MIRLLLLFHFLFSFISWNYYGIFFIINILILFIIIDKIYHKNIYHKIFIFYIYFILLNLSSVFWLIKFDVVKGILTIFANSFVLLFFSIPLLINKKLVFIFSYTIGEYLASLWDLAFPWLNFGNVLGDFTFIINFYKFIGVYGGTFILLLISFFTFKVFILKKKYNMIGVFLIFTLIISSNFYDNLPKKFNERNIILYLPKKTNSNYERLKKIIKNDTIKNYEYLLTPEIFLKEININYDIELINTFELLNKTKTKKILCAEISNNKLLFNGLFVHTQNNKFFRTKKKYVPIVEYTNPILESLFGKTYYSKNFIDDEKEIINELGFKPYLCYESVFSIESSDINNNLIVVLASESFMKNSIFAKKQYLRIMKIRAIENQKYLVKCSNDGISCVINPKGEVEKTFNKELNYFSVKFNNKPSFYQKIINL